MTNHPAIPPAADPPRRPTPAKLAHARAAAIVYDFEGVRYVRAIHAPPGRAALLRARDGVPLLAWDGEPLTSGVLRSLIREGRMRRRLDVGWLVAKPTWMTTRVAESIMTQQVMVWSCPPTSGFPAGRRRRRRARQAASRRS